MKKIKRYTMFVIIMVIYYYYRITTAVFKPNKPVISFFFWKNERELIQRNTTLAVITIALILMCLTFGIGWMLITLTVLVGVVGILTVVRMYNNIK